MDPVTHFLTGACLGRSGFNRKTAYATLTMTLAAEAPDIDILGGLGGPVTGFCHHRGITHTFVGAPFMALAVTALVWGLSRLARKLGRKPPRQPVHWQWLWLLALLADLSHLLLDYTNNYGLRPFFPFNPHWYAWSIVFIFEPVLFAALLLGLLMPALLGLVEGEMRRRTPGALRGRAWAIAALTAAGLLYGVRGAGHARALELAAAAGSSTPEPLLRVAAEPVMFNPWTWNVLTETRSSYGSATVHTRTGAVEPGEQLPKPPLTPAVAAAEASYLGRVYRDWSSWPSIEDIGAVPPPGSASPLPPGARTVVFRDLRFSPRALTENNAPLTGFVALDSEGHVLAQWMDGREQK